MDGTHGRTTFEDDPKQQLPRGQPMGIGTMAVQAGKKMQMLGIFSTIISARDSDLVGNMIFQTHQV